MWRGFSLIIVFSMLFSSCKDKNDIKLVDHVNFKTTIEGRNVDLYDLDSGNGLYMQVTNYGARVVSLWMADRNGKYSDIVLGHNNIKNYMNATEGRYFGATVGRYANRIATASFVIDTVKYSLSDNNKGNCIHGGQNGLDRVVWSVDSVSTNKICFSYVSPDGDQGFPGELKINMTYTLTDDNQFVINYAATTTKTTFVNFSHHSFFNLKGEGNGTILDHIVTINSDSITLVDSNMIPSGVIASVESTPFDFSKPTAIGDRINADDEQLKFVSGYDHNWVLDCTKGVVHAATVYEPSTGRCMEVWTDQPGMQFYTSNSLHGANKGKSGKGYNFRESFAMETQKYPDSPHHSNFPSALLNPDQTYIQTCIYKFSVQK